MSSSRSTATLSLTDSIAHERYIYQRLEEISKKISPTPPNQFQPSSGSPRQLLGSPSKLSVSSSLGKGSIHMEEVKELSNLVMVLQENLRNVQDEYFRILKKAETEAQKNFHLEENLKQAVREVTEYQSLLEESEETNQALRLELQQLQIKHNQREKHILAANEETDLFLQKIHSLQTRLRESEDTLRETDKIRTESLAEMKQHVAQFKVDLEFAACHISLLTSQKSQVWFTFLVPFHDLTDRLRRSLRQQRSGRIR
jgi:predicted S18 family serine protease